MAGPYLREVSYRIGLWFWEVSSFPPQMHAAFGVVDELWVGSTFIADALRGESARPVHVVPLPVEVATPTTDARSALGLDPGFLVLFSFDFESVFARKNPLGVIEAFRRRFPQIRAQRS